MLESEDKQNEKLKADKAAGRIKKEMANAMTVDRRKRNRDKWVFVFFTNALINSRLFKDI